MISLVLYTTTSSKSLSVAATVFSGTSAVVGVTPATAAVYFSNTGDVTASNFWFADQSPYVISPVATLILPGRVNLSVLTFLSATLVRLDSATGVPSSYTYLIVRVTSSCTFTALINASVHFGPSGLLGSSGVTPGVGFGLSLLAGFVGSNDGISTT